MQFFISFLAGVVIFYAFRYFPLSAVFIFLLSLIYCSFKKRFLLVIIIILGIVSAITFSFIRQKPTYDTYYIGEEITARGIFESYPIKTDTGVYRQSLRVNSAINKDSDEYLDNLIGEEVILFSDREFDLGTEYELVIRFTKSRARLNPGQTLKGDIYARTLYVHDSKYKKISLKSKIEECRYKIYEYIEQNFSKDSASLISSITIGHRANIDEELRDAFNVSGLAHILSISTTVRLKKLKLGVIHFSHFENCMAI
ncbi:MAG: hypothetical protein AB1610_02865 [Nitrospirota bacterium]